LNNRLIENKIFPLLEKNVYKKYKETGKITGKNYFWGKM
jgi:hypothetical protein